MQKHLPQYREFITTDCDEEALVTVALSTDTIPCDKTGIAIYFAEKIKEDKEDEQSEWSDSDSDCFDIMIVFSRFVVI
jgi:hypothetical protein